MFRLTGVFRAVRRTDLCRSISRTVCSRTDLCRSISRTVCSRTDLCRSISRTVCSRTDLCRTDLCRSISRTVCSRTDLCRSISRTVCRTDYWTPCRSILCRTDSRTTILCRSFCSSTDMAKGKFYYAVKTGFKPGVYSSWDECKSQVDKFPAASFKKFASEKDAWAFFRGVEPSPVPEVKKVAPCVESADALLPKRGPEPLEYIPLGKKRCHSDEDAESQPKRVKPSESSSSESSSSESTDGFTYMGDAVVVYTDGCCSCNGQKGARAGIGVYWGHNHPLNAAEPLEGRQTNQRAEVQAACKALEQAKENNIKKLVLYTDSKFTINGVTTWVKNWKLNGWRLKSGGQITNKDDFVKLDRLNAELEVVWLHIPGHAGYKGNEEADRLSREGAAKPRQQQQQQQQQ